MTYDSPRALRTALEHRLLQRATETGVSLDRLRRRVIFERVLARLSSAEPGAWVVKGGMALEVRLRDDARLTKDLDLGLRDNEVTAESLHERLIDVLSLDPAGDRFDPADGQTPGRHAGRLETGRGRHHHRRGLERGREEALRFLRYHSSLPQEDEAAVGLTAGAALRAETAG